MAFRPKETIGVVLPLSSKGKRSSVAFGKQTLSDAVIKNDSTMASHIQSETNWRFGYAKHFVASVKLSLQSPKHAIEISQAGLDSIYSNAQFIREGKETRLVDAMEAYTGSFHTHIIKGKQKKPSPPSISYRGKQLSGERLISQVNHWAKVGTVEPSVAEAVRKVLSNQKTWLDLSSHYFVLFGANSEMGPFECLLKLGANVIAVDIDRPAIWKRLISVAKDSYGTLTFPTKKPYSPNMSRTDLSNIAGCNLLTQTPEICNWLLSLYPGKMLTVGSYVYLDGDMFVRVVIACDAITKRLLKLRKPKISLAFLGSGADIFVVPPEARDMAESRINKFNFAQIAQRTVNFITNGRHLVPNHHMKVSVPNGKKFYITDGLSNIQGPNYALAKRIQHWRAVVSRHNGSVVSSNVAPASFTKSVMHSKITFAVSQGVSTFIPIEVFYPSVSQMLMTLLLVHDLFSPTSAAHPKTTLSNPLELMSETAFHCGVWRSAVKIGSSGEVSVLIYYAKNYGLHIATVFGAAIAGTAVIKARL